MLKFHIWTIGCQMNKAESVQISKHLYRHGYVLTARLSEADLVVLNTCVVRQAAEDKVLGTLGYLKGTKNHKSNPYILVTGCFVNSKEEALYSKFPYVDLFFKPGEYTKLLQWLKKHHDIDNRNEIIQPAVQKEGIVAYVPIIQGCNNFCSYCIVPYRRGREKSRPVDEVVNEARGLVSRGAREITLVGQ